MSPFYTHKIMQAAKICAAMGIFYLFGLMEARAQLNDTFQDSAAVSAASQDTLPVGKGASAQKSQQSLGNLQEGEIQFQAKDSLVFDFRQDRIAKLYGSSTVNHNAGKLE